MNDSSSWILQHGWGCNSSFWSRWGKFAPQGTALHILDRGYFGDPVCWELLDSKPKVIVTHSFGLHLIPDALFQIADALVIFSGFFSFHDSAMHRQGISTVDLMLKRLAVDPWDVLSRFQRKCFFPSKYVLQPMPPKIDHALLIADLTHLNRNHFDVNSIKRISKTLIVHGLEDQIVPFQRAEELQKMLPHSKIVLVKHAGHAVPITHAEWCCHTIECFVNSEK